MVLERVRGNKEYPFVSFISYFNPSIPLTGDEDFTQPLYGILENKYDIIVKTSKEEVSARLAGEFIAEKLDIELKEDVYREGDINVKAKRYYTYKHKKPPYHFDMEASL